MLKIKATHTVKPVAITTKFVPLTHATTVYFYRNPGHFTSNVNILKDSLSRALDAFYPLAGPLRWIARNRLEIDFNPLGAELLEAESESRIDDFALTPPIDYTTPIHELPLLLVQVTKFKCGGICVGLAISYVIVDGRSALLFATEWAKIARGENLDNASPFLDWSILLAQEPARPPKFDHPEFNPPPLLIGHSSHLEERKKKFVVAMLKLTKEQITKLRDKANEGQANNLYGRYTTFMERYEAVTGHLWRCASKAREHASEQLTVQWWTSETVWNHQYRSQFFGNAITRINATTTAGELVLRPLRYASNKKREAIESVTAQYVMSSLDFVRSQEELSRYCTFHTVGCAAEAAVYFHNPNMQVTSWGGLNLYGADFGWGNELYMGPAAIGTDGKAYFFPAHEGDGFFNVIIGLQVAHMDAFKKFFYQDV
ncbi:LOW QUALITY PROTEIN: hypothetical protein RJ640_016186 [Escallonia rubra]|uniref:Uncharacterized protein n=1 Tax=Escallonia rubra TaxID=112253 RepID=A0AA88QXG1_9ASTE|nr:LOW QUALITY PROTEIN: hypothetical protein RJ640_016186 [Escallonia rubra]